MPRTKVLILTALRIEARHVRSALGSAADIDVRVIGIGAVHLPDIGAEKPDCVILAGFAGGLSPELRVGDVIVDLAGGQFEMPAGACRSAIHGSANAVTSVKQKHSLFLSNQCVAVDMESGPVRIWARQADLPLVVIRAISDSADESLSEELLALVDVYGSPRFGRIAWAILGKPRLLLEFLKLAGSARKAGKNLRRALHQFIELNRARFGCKEPSQP